MPTKPTPTPTVTLLAALTRATSTEFTRNDWDAWMGAEGDARMVHWHPDDVAAVLAAVELDHVPAEYVTTIVDNGGLTFNVNSPVNMYAWHVEVRLEVQPSDMPLEENYWRADEDMRSRGWPSAADVTVAGLPAEFRLQYYACPEAARPYVLAGYLAAQAQAQTPAETAPAAEQPAPRPQAVVAGETPRMLCWWVQQCVSLDPNEFWVCVEQELNGTYSVPCTHATSVGATQWGHQHLSTTLYNHRYTWERAPGDWRRVGNVGQGAFLIPATPIQVTSPSL